MWPTTTIRNSSFEEDTYDPIFYLTSVSFINRNPFSDDNENKKEDQQDQEEEEDHKEECSKEEDLNKPQFESIFSIWEDHKDKDKEEDSNNPLSYSIFAIEEEQEHKEKDDNKDLNQPWKTSSEDNNEDLNQPHIVTSTMVDPKYDIERIDKDILRLLKYSRSSHRKNDPIPLALVQSFGTIGNVVWTDILLPQNEIHETFISYKRPDGSIMEISQGQRTNFSLAVLYAQYRFSQPKGDTNALQPSKWTVDKFYAWQLKIKCHDDHIAAARAMLPKIVSTKMNPTTKKKKNHLDLLNQSPNDIDMKMKINTKKNIDTKKKIDTKQKFRKTTIKMKTKIEMKTKIKDDDDKSQVYSPMIMKPKYDAKYDVSNIDKELLRFLDYTCSGHCNDDPIPLALVQEFWDVTWFDILLGQDQIHEIFDQYEARDSTIFPITAGQRFNFSIAVLYIKYQYSRVKDDKHARNPSKWTKQEYKNWTRQVQTSKGPAALIIAKVINTGLTKLQTSQFETRMEFLAMFLSKIHRYNDFANEHMSSSICFAHLNAAISDDKALNTGIASIDVDVNRPEGKKLNKFGVLLEQC